MTTIAAVGDIMLGDHPVRIGHGVRSRHETLGGGRLFDDVVGVWKGSDIVFGNLEVVHSDLGLVRERIESFEFRGAPSAVHNLRDAGFTVLSVANNHCMQHGRQAFEESAQTLRESGIFPLGVQDNDGRATPYRRSYGSERVVLLGYSMRMEEHCPRQSLPYSWADEEVIAEEVRSHAEGGALVVVSLHWGDEFLNYPSLGQIQFAHRLVESGASIILGHHPHVLQGVERYKGAVIAYSLGNFVFDMWQPATRHSMVLTVGIEGREVRECRITPIQINRHYQPELSGDSSYYERAESLLVAQLEKLNLPEAERSRHEETYRASAVRRMRRHRYENYGYFMAHLASYQPSFVWQSLRRSFSRRREEMAESLRGTKPSDRI